MSTEEGTSTGNHNQEHFGCTGASFSCSEEATLLNTVALTFVSYNLMVVPSTESFNNTSLGFQICKMGVVP